MIELKEVETRIPDSVLSTLFNFPHAFPKYYRHTKAVRRHSLGRKLSEKFLRNSIFGVYVLDDDYGVVEIARIHGRHVRRKKNGKSHIDFHTKYEKTRVIIYHVSIVEGDEAESHRMLNASYAMLKNAMNEPLSMWSSPAGMKRGQIKMELNAFCDDSFEDPTNTIAKNEDTNEYGSNTD